MMKIQKSQFDEMAKRAGRDIIEPCKLPFEFELVDDMGRVLSDVGLVIRGSTGDEAEYKTDSSGLVTLEDGRTNSFELVRFDDQHDNDLSVVDIL